MSIISRLENNYSGGNERLNGFCLLIFYHAGEERQWSQIKRGNIVEDYLFIITAVSEILELLFFASQEEKKKEL